MNTDMEKNTATTDPSKNDEDEDPVSREAGRLAMALAIDFADSAQPPPIIYARMDLLEDGVKKLVSTAEKWEVSEDDPVDAHRLAAVIVIIRVCTVLGLRIVEGRDGEGWKAEAAHG